MNEPPTYYQIDLRGHTSPRVLGPFEEDFQMVVLDDTTRLVGKVRDAAHLHGVINHLISLAIEVISITPADASARTTFSDLKQTNTERQEP